MKRLLWALMLLSMSTAAWAQTAPTPPGTTRLGWDHDGQNVTRWELAIDGATPTEVVATSIGTNQWATPFPALTPGNHAIIVRACNQAGCTGSDPFNVTVIASPNPFPNGGNVRIISGDSE